MLFNIGDRFKRKDEIRTIIKLSSQGNWLIHDNKGEWQNTLSSDSLKKQFSRNYYTNYKSINSKSQSYEIF